MDGSFDEELQDVAQQHVRAVSPRGARVDKEVARAGAVQRVAQEEQADGADEYKTSEWYSEHAQKSHGGSEAEEHLQLLQAEEPERTKVLNHGDQPKLQPEAISSKNCTNLIV